MYTNIVCSIVFLITSINMLKGLNMDPEHFGPYNVGWKKYELCKGPKSKNVSEIVNALNVEGDNYYGLFNFTFNSKTRIDEIKIKVYSLKGNTKSLLWTYNLNNPCEHFAFATIIESTFKGPNCMIRKGSYESRFNLKEITKTFFGSSFFYGDFWLKANVLNKDGNIMCINLLMVITKKSE